MTPIARLKTMFAPGPGGALNPRLVLLIAILLPGFGHVVCGQARRGLTMQLFMVSLGFITWHLTTPQHSLVGRLSGGLFIYALSVMEAYKIARIRWAAGKGSSAA